MSSFPLDTLDGPRSWWECWSTWKSATNDGQVGPSPPRQLVFALFTWSRRFWKEPNSFPYAENLLALFICAYFGTVTARSPLNGRHTKLKRLNRGRRLSRNYSKSEQPTSTYQIERQLTISLDLTRKI